MNSQRLAALIRERLIFVKLATMALWIAWIASMAFTGFARDIDDKPIGTDHVAFYSAAKLIDEGQGDRIYDWGFLGEYQPKLTGHTNWYLDAYRNPPFYALLYVPTSRLPYLVSFWIWTALALVLLWFGLGWLGAEKQFTAFVLSLSFYPVFAVFGFGQNSLLSFGFFCLSFRFMDRRQYFLAGVAAGMLLYKPQLLLGLVLWWTLGFRTYWRCLFGLAAMGYFWLTVSVLVLPNETGIFIDKLEAIAGYNAFMFWNLHNPKAFFTLIAYDDKAIGSALGAVCSVAAVIFFVLFWKRHCGNVPIMFGAAVSLTLWASPHTMIYEWTLAVIPAVLLWERVKERRDEWLILFSIAWIALFISTPISQALFIWTRNPQTGAGWAIQVSVPALAWVGLRAARILKATPVLPPSVIS